jgi:UrcA family protein
MPIALSAKLDSFGTRICLIFSNNLGKFLRHISADSHWPHCQCSDIVQMYGDGPLLGHDDLDVGCDTQTGLWEGNVMAVTGKLLTGVALAISLGSAVAYADSPPAVGFPHSSVVRYQDLNLDRPQDVAKLYARITLAADKLCGPRSLTGSYVKSADYASCFTDTVAQAVARVDKPALSAYFRQRSPEPVSREISIAQQ